MEATASRGEPIGAPTSIPNPHLAPLRACLAPLHASGGLDCMGLYVYGLVLDRLGEKEPARNVLLESVRAWPLLWAAWSELARGCDSPADADRLAAGDLPAHWCSRLFLAECSLSMQQGEAALKVLLEASAGVFEHSLWVRERLGRALSASRGEKEGQGESGQGTNRRERVERRYRSMVAVAAGVVGTVHCR